MSARNLSGSLKTAPFPLIATSDPNGMLGLAEGKLGRFDAQTGRWQEIKESPSKIESIVWPKPEGLYGRPISQLLVQAILEGSKQFHRLDVTASGAKLISALTVPSEASLVDYSPAKDLVLYSTKTSEGTFLWSNNGGNGAVVRRFSINEHLAKISEPRRVLIDYYSGDGQILQGLVLLPIGYREGTRYPLITYVYPGTIIRTPNYFAAYKNSLIMLNLQLLASKGYVVLIPSIPLGPEGEASDPYLDIPKGVLPALDKVIEKGIADPDRLGVIGQSYGGYGVYGLVTFTHRFKAAISLAGLSNLVSLYGTFDARTRYTDESSIRMNQAALAETSQVRMGNTLWVDSTRYIRNSPIFYLDRVETPLLIIQGDLDYVAIQQGEEFFTGLHRLGKRARFVRYWGEGHGPHSPANVRDMWGRIYDWFSEHLARKD
jgi:dipeptidyl aminopeptidase/acylaminoacyl peptidase